jgi:hypothetical protein
LETLMTLRKALALTVAILIAAAPLSAAQTKPVDLTGKWTGTLTSAGEGAGPAHIELTQKAAEVTGTAGPSPDRQFPLSNGKVATVKGVTTVTFDATQPNGLVMKFDLKLVDGRLQGQVTAERDGQKREGAVDLGRAK